MSCRFLAFFVLLRIVDGYLGGLWEGLILAKNSSRLPILIAKRLRDGNIVALISCSMLLVARYEQKK
jgi:hypothetical protein